MSKNTEISALRRSKDCARRLVLRTSYLVLLAASLASCDFTQMPNSVAAYTMHLSDYEVTVMVGDTVDVTCLFEPDSVTAPKAFWHRKSPNIAIDNADGYTYRVIGTQPGDAWVYAVTLNDNLQDSCLVHVMTRWSTFDSSDYEYDMVVIADIDIDGVHNSTDYEYAAFIGDQVRGLGRVLTTQGKTYTAFRIYNNWADFGTVQFRYYDPHTRHSSLLDYTLDFDGELHGTPSEPIRISNSE